MVGPPRTITLLRGRSMYEVMGRKAVQGKRSEQDRNEKAYEAEMKTIYVPLLPSIIGVFI